jgi:hypothetical protein
VLVDPGHRQRIRLELRHCPERGGRR